VGNVGRRGLVVVNLFINVIVIALAACAPTRSRPAAAPRPAEHRPPATSTTTHRPAQVDPPIAPIDTGSDYPRILQSLLDAMNQLVEQPADPALIDRVMARGSSGERGMQHQVRYLRDHHLRYFEVVNGASRLEIVSVTPDAVSARYTQPLARFGTVDRRGRPVKLIFPTTPTTTYLVLMVKELDDRWRLASVALKPDTNIQLSSADTVDPSASLDGSGIAVGLTVDARDAAAPPRGGDQHASAIPLLTREVVAVSAETGSLAGACLLPGNPSPPWGFQYHILYRDATGTVRRETYPCIPFPSGDPNRRPQSPPLPDLPTLGEVWRAARLPVPGMAVDPRARGITGLDTRIAAASPGRVTTAASLHGYRIAGTADLDHFVIGVDGHEPGDARVLHHRFTTKGDHTVTIGTVWKGSAIVSGADLDPPVVLDDIGTATITATRRYPVHEIRSVLQ